MTDLINRLENATGADRELEVALYMQLDPKAAWPEGMDADAIWNWLSYFKSQWVNTTASLDAALALVGECGQVVQYISWHRFEGEPEVVHATVGPSHFERKVGRHKSPAIALLIALLKAHALLKAKD